MKLSIIIPVYQSEKTIIKCIKSINQLSLDKNQDYEIIVIDDGSTDNSVNYINDMTDCFPIKILSQKNSGPAIARNLAINHSTGDYIFFIDSDDFFIDKISSIVSILKNNQPDVVVFSYKTQDIFSKQIFSASSRDKKILSCAPTNSFTISLYPDITLLIAYPWNKAYKRDFLLSNDIFFPNFRLQEDVEFHFKSLSKAKSIYVVNQPIICHTFGNQASMSLDFSKNRLTCITALAQANEACNNFLKDRNNLYWKIFCLDILCFYLSKVPISIQQHFLFEIKKLLSDVKLFDLAKMYLILKKYHMSDTAIYIKKKIINKKSIFSKILWKLILVFNKFYIKI